MPGKVLIVAPPPGEAPDWVRQAWVGLELPFENPTPGGYVGGVLSKKPTGRNGFHVPPQTAIAILKNKDSRAAAWWLEHVDIAHMDAFVFDPVACKVLD